MPQIIGYDVSIVVDGQQLPEYNATIDESRGFPVATCWVPSEAGKVFHIDIIPPPGPRCSNISFKLLLDGRVSSVRGNILTKTSEADLVRLWEENTSAHKARSFQFGTLHLTENEALLSTDTEALGDIHLKLNSVDRYEAVPRKDEEPGQMMGEIHERSKKAMVHCIQGGQERLALKSKYTNMAIGKARIAEVIFKYRSQDVLIADGIAPRGSSRAALPPGPSHVNAVAGPSHSKKRKASAPSGCAKVEDRKRLKVTEEVRALKARLAALEAEIRDDSPVPEVKQELKSEVRPYFIPREVIDLTLD